MTISSKRAGGIIRRREHGVLSRLRRAVARTALLSVAVLALAGCAGVVRRDAVPAQLTNVAEVPGAGPIRFWGDEATPSLEKLAASTRFFSQRQPRNVNSLTLSGGGANGAYGVGYLLGWTARGDRPKFDIVTGISVGALIAPMAFLGTTYDARLKAVFMNLAQSRAPGPGVLAGIFGAPAVASNRPLKVAIADLIDQQALDAIAREYGRGRLLLVGTTNLDAERPVVWNIGAIAASDNPDRLELVRSILLASAAIPGVYPPVLINVVANGTRYSELHVDGGVTQEVILVPEGASIPKARSGSKQNLYLIYNGVVQPEWSAVNPTALSLVARSIPTLIKYLGRQDIAALASKAKASGVGFHLITIPPSFKTTIDILPDPKYLDQLFAVGLAAGQAGE
ncbi:MAG: hypothetical protein JWN11_2259 [Hyphomicrobiales bacterium]|nr:hypothetical protein [Hyphomicrobiales bacterium]